MNLTNENSPQIVDWKTSSFAGSAAPTNSSKHRTSLAFPNTPNEITTDICPSKTTTSQNQTVVRNAAPGDIAGISALIATCAPYLTKHGDYLYLIYTRYFSDGCAVAENRGKIVGWCSMLPTGQSHFFIHQLGVLPETRGSGIAFALLMHVLSGPLARFGKDLAVEFTTDRRNQTAQSLNLKVAQALNMRIERLDEPVPVFEEGSTEELYRMTPLNLPQSEQLDIDWKSDATGFNH